MSAEAFYAMENPGESARGDEATSEKGGAGDLFVSSLEKAVKKLGLDVEERAMEGLSLYFTELSRWNQAYNLVGRRLGAEGITELIIDSVTPLCIKGLLGAGMEVVDIGSGAGMPGIPLYLLAGPFSLTLVESVRKKITFLRHVIRRLGLENVSVYAGRVEKMASEEDRLNAYDVALARAEMEPFKLLKVARPLLSEGGRAVLYLGSGGVQELRKNALRLEEKGWKLESVRSTQRFTGKDVYLALMRKEVRAGRVKG